MNQNQSGNDISFKNEYLLSYFDWREESDPVTGRVLTTLYVGTVEWNDGNPELIWHKKETYEEQPSQREQDAIVGHYLNDSDYFRICGTCHDISNIGHMHNNYLCRNCAEL